MASGTRRDFSRRRQGQREANYAMRTLCSRQPMAAEKPIAATISLGETAPSQAAPPFAVEVRRVACSLVADVVAF